MDSADLDALDARIQAWVNALPSQGLGVAGVERITDAPRAWYLRLDGDEKQNFSIVLTLDQRTVKYDSYFMPEPEENHAALYEHLLVRNRRLYGLSFVIGEDRAVHLVGQLDNRAVTEAELDRVLGSVYMTTEQCFRPAMRIGYASRFDG